jgi:endonuclease/exonuclease/phosphatase family metal-dependent hydrolase|tara:strand:+ start:7164 stop:8918 length:1755 start_codon:yes stop_codon:yes gene_type:complete
MILFAGESLPAQTTYSQIVMTYNLWNYGGTSSSDDEREGQLRAVVSAVNPDLLIVEEVDGTDGFEHFLDDVLNYEHSGLFRGAPFYDQPSTDIDIGLYYKAEHFDLVSSDTIDITSNWGHRDAAEFMVRHLATGTVLRLYGIHFKAGNGDDDAVDRESEAAALRSYLNTLESDSQFLVMGDFNVYNAAEEGYQRLVESQANDDGRLFDPIDEAGNWHNDVTFAQIHTQSTRSSYRGWNYGGMDDRFDFILASSSILDATDLNYVSDSYTAFGNDGNHFNDAINSGSNEVVSDEMADALVEASDHLPVFLELAFEASDTGTPAVVITEIMQNPSAVSDSQGEWFEIHNTDSVATDLCGWTVKDLGGDSFVIGCYDYFWIEPGKYLVMGTNNNGVTNGGLTVDYQYDYELFNLANGDDEIILMNGAGVEIDRVEYDGGVEFPDPDGKSMALKDVWADNSVGSNWTVSTVPFGDGDLGTPSEANHDVSLVTEVPLPEHFNLYPNFPNPFNGTTVISFDLSTAALVQLSIYDLAGRKVDLLLIGELASGYHSTVWNAAKLPSGIYLYQLTAGSRQLVASLVRKMVLLK